MRKIRRDIVRGSLKEEIARFSFKVASGEELCGAPLVWMPNLNEMVLHLLEENYRYLIITHTCNTSVYKLMCSVLDGSPGMMESYQILKYG